MGKIRNTNRILGELSPYLSKFREEYSTVYYLNVKGREYVNSDKVRKKGNKAHHTLVRNEFYIYSGCPSDWKNEVRVTDGQFKVITDSWFKVNNRYNFLEVDLQQPMKENRVKIEHFKGLFQNKAIANKLGYFPTLTWLTTTELRRKQLKELCKDIPCIVYTLSDIK